MPKPRDCKIIELRATTTKADGTPMSEWLEGTGKDPRCRRGDTERCGCEFYTDHRCVKLYVIPINCWRPITGTGIPADAERHPPGCPDADWCRGNRCCYWDCKGEQGGDDL